MMMVERTWSKSLARLKVREVQATAAAAVLGVALAGSAARAQEGDRELEVLKRMLEEVIAENRELTGRVRELEARMQELQAARPAPAPVAEAAPAQEAPEVAEAAPAEEPGAEEEAPAEPSEEEDLWSMINRYVNFGGAIEVEAEWFKDFEGDSGSDIRLDTAELDFEIQAHEWVSGLLKIEFDDNDGNDQLAVDEAFVTIGNLDEYPWFLRAGRLFATFGLSTGDEVSDTLTISDPLTFEVFETTRKDQVFVGVEEVQLFGDGDGFFETRRFYDGVHAGAYVFDGDNDETSGGDHLENWGATVGYQIGRQDTQLAVGADVISSVLEADGLREEFPGAPESKYAPGIATHAQLRLGDFSLVGEYLQSLDDIRFTEAVEEDGGEDGGENGGEDGGRVRIQPVAWQVGGAYETELLGRDTFVALTYSRTDDLATAFPESRIAFAIGRWQFDDTRITIEYLRDWDYGKGQGGTGNSADAFTAQLTYEW
jgi:hypothetical protein